MAISLDADERVLLVARSAEPIAVRRCLEAMPETEPAVFDGHDALRYRDAQTVVFADDLVLFGDAEPLERALGRLRDEVPASRGKLFAQIEPEVSVAGLTFDIPGKFQGRVKARIARGELLVEGFVAPPPPLHNGKRQASTTELIDQRRRVQREVASALEILLGATHPLLTGWQRHNVEDAARVGFRWTFPLRALRLEEARQGILRQRREDLVNEARNNIAAIARGASMSHERHGRLCQSSTAVPTDVPKAEPYHPSQKTGQDFMSGDPKRGWACLNFHMTHPVRYRYAYAQGSGYRGPSRGLPDPGPRGFEVSAEGDLDGDGNTSLLTIIGRVDAKTGQLRIQYPINEVDPSE